MSFSRKEERVLTFYRCKLSTNVERVALALAHKGLKPESVWVPFEDRTVIRKVSEQPPSRS